MTTKTIRDGRLEYEIKQNGIEVSRVLNAMQSEFVGLISWSTFQQIAEAKNEGK